MRANKQIKKASEEIRKAMQLNLANISASIILRVMKNYKKLPNAQKRNAIKDIKASGLNVYKSDLLAAMAVASFDALSQARNEVPKAKKVKLMENEERLLFGEFEKLPPDIRKRIKSSNELLIGTQIADLEKAIFFQFLSSLASEKSEKEIEFDMIEKSSSYIEGNAIKAGAAVTAANIVNEARNAFFFNKETLEQIEAFQFMNGDPVSPICNDLAGTIFRKDDPDAFRYTPPLHYNCKSWIRPIIVLKKGQEIQKLEPSTKELKDSIQFSDINEASSDACQNRCCIHL